MQSVKRLLPYLKPYRATIFFTLLLGVLMSSISLGTAKLLKTVVDDIFVAKSSEMLVLAPFIIVGLYLLSGIIRFFHMFLLRYTGDVIAIDIRNDLQIKYMHLSLDFHGANSTGSLISKTMNDVILIQSGLTLLADVVREPVNALALLGYLFYVNWKLTCITIIAAPVLIMGSKSLGRSVRKYSRSMQEILEELTNALKETLDGIRIIKAFGLENHMRNRFQRATKSFLSIRKHILSREELAGPVFELMGAITIAAILYYAGTQALRGETTIGAFTSFVFVLGLLQAPIKKLQDAHVRLQHTVAASQRIFSILDSPISVKDPEDSGMQSKPWPHDWQTVEFKDVKFSYGNREVLNGVNLRVARGEVVAIVGSSGAGKTTLVNLLPRFYDITAGSIEIGGTDIRNMKLADLRKHIGLVSQDVFLFNEGIRDNIVAGQSSNDQERVFDAVQAAHAQEFVGKLPAKLGTIVGERGSKLSGGERQRISIARALYKNSPILILDEATSSLDSESEKTVQAALDELMKGRTTFVIAHRLSTIQKAHRIVVVSEGKIVEVGSHSELIIQKGIYHKLYTNQFEQL